MQILRVLTVFCSLYLVSHAAFSQQTFRAKLLDSHTNDPLPGASVYFPALELGGISNAEGDVQVEGIPEGKYKIRISYISYETQFHQLSFTSASADSTYTFRLEAHDEELEEVVVTSTRSSRSIEDIPTRLEYIAGEELAEKANMKPGNIRMLLSESTGIQTQQTSATSYNSSIRIQGLDGRYTQLLRNGLPLYSGFSGGLSIMQIAPLDLKQVEVIKGASSTLYGGGAIAGLVNLIAKTPEEEPELSFMLNGTSALGFDASGFYAQKYGKVGTTLFASYNKGTAYDPADIGLTAIPEFDRFTLNPVLYFYPGEHTQLNVGINFVTEERLGGELAYIKGDKLENAYFERNITSRFSSQLLATHKIAENRNVEVKNSISFYDREINIPEYRFAGEQRSSFTEINYAAQSSSSEWVSGLNLWTEAFIHDDTPIAQDLSYSNYTVGAFGQNIWSISEKWMLESGFRLDYQRDYGLFPLPRFSLMVKPKDDLTLRLGGGMGYKSPTVFTEEAERIQFQNVLNPDLEELKPERSFGGNFDINYSKVFGEIGLNTNILLFYTQIQDPLNLVNTTDGLDLRQVVGYIDTKGIEVNMKWSWKDFKLFSGYTLSDVHQYTNGEIEHFPLVARHRLNNVLMYEKHEKFRIGLEGYYFSRQPLTDGRTGKPYWIFGLMAEKQFGEHLSVFLNFENFTDTRQTEFESIYTGDISNPQFNDIYAPLDGFVSNGGIKLNF